MKPSEGFDPGAAAERTALAWNRTGLSAAAAGAIALKLFWGESMLGVGLAVLLVATAALAYAAPASPLRFRALSLAVTAAAVLSGVLTLRPR